MEDSKINSQEFDLKICIREAELRVIRLHLGKILEHIEEIRKEITDIKVEIEKEESYG